MDSKNRKVHIIVAAGIAVAVAVWMISGLGSEPPGSQESVFSNSAPGALTVVRIADVQAKEITREVLVSGRTLPDRIVSLRAETEGLVSAISTERGSVIDKDETLLTLDMRDRQARLTEARAIVNQRQLAHKAMVNMQERQFTSQTQIAEARALLDGALAAQERIELEISNIEIKAPFAGVVEQRTVEIGDFVRVGDEVATIVDLDPIIISGDVNEREIADIAIGGSGTAILSDGSTVTGKIRYLSRVADEATRTFRVELAVANPDNRYRAGMTAELRLQADTISVHELSSALLSLADDGTVGVKTVDATDTVNFYPVTIAGATGNALQVTGLPERIRLITVGQGFVKAGQQVQANKAGGE